MTEIFSRNFDFETSDEIAELEGAKAPPTMTQVEAEMLIEQAKKAAFEEGRIAGAAEALSSERNSRAAKLDEALVSLSQDFMDLAARDHQLRTELALEMGEIVTDVGERLVPDLFEAHISDLLVARINSGIRVAAGEGRVTIKVPPELADELTPRLEALTQSVEQDGLEFKILADEQIEDWTIRMNWRNGVLEYDPAFASAEALSALKETISELKTQVENTH